MQEVTNPVVIATCDFIHRSYMYAAVPPKISSFSSGSFQVHLKYQVFHQAVFKFVSYIISKIKTSCSPSRGTKYKGKPMEIYLWK
jgi:hypothetical protein